MKRRVFPILATVSFAIALVTVALWVRTGILNLTDEICWGPPGVYRTVQLSQDDFEFKSLHDPGFTPTRLQWFIGKRGWVHPPPPSNPAALPRTSVTWVLPQPNDMFHSSQTRRIVLPIGFDYAELRGWYGPGTTLHAYRLSYFTVMLPALLLPGWWLIKATLAWRRRRAAPGICRRCGYDLRASTDRCPECGEAIEAGQASVASVEGG